MFSAISLLYSLTIGTASADPHSTSQFHFMSQLHSTSAPVPNLTSSMTEDGGGRADDVSSPGNSHVPVIVGVLVAVVMVIVLISLVVAAVTCYKVKVLKKYNVEAHSSSNGELVPMIPSPHSYVLCNLTP